MSIDYKKLEAERISSTKIYAYDQITAVSEASVNFQLNAMYGMNPTLRKMSATLDDDDWASIESTLGPSTVELQLNTDSASPIYRLSMTSLTFSQIDRSSSS